MLSAQLLTTEFNAVLGRVDATRCIFVSLVPLSSAGVASISPLLNLDGTITVQAILDAAIATLKTNPNTVVSGDVRIYQDALKSLLDAINNNGSIFVPCPPTP